MDLKRVLDGIYQITFKVIGHITRKSGLIRDQWSKYMEGKIDSNFWFTALFVLKTKFKLAWID